MFDTFPKSNQHPVFYIHVKETVHEGRYVVIDEILKFRQSIESIRIS